MISKLVPTHEDLIDVSELSRRLGLPIQAIRDMGRKGDVPSFKLRNRRMFLWSEVLTALKNGSGK